jgi:hypothetical protein
VRDYFLDGLPIDQIVSAYNASPGDEIKSGKFASPESSAALVANAFGFFLNSPQVLPAIPGCASLRWPPVSLRLEAEVRFPWSGGRHPWLDVLIETQDALVGVESKRFEPFRDSKKSTWSNAYWRDWGEGMEPYARVRDELHDGRFPCERLDAAQLVKHAFGLSTAARRSDEPRKAVLVYLFHEPTQWPDGRPVEESLIAMHRDELAAFAQLVGNAEVAFFACTYREVIKAWMASLDPTVRRHALAVANRFQL